MKKLFLQLVKFGMVGALCFLIDYGLYTGLLFLNVYYLVAAFIGFVVSVIVNYLLSMKYVFVRREDMDRRKEFIIFIILSIFGLLLNELIIWLCYDVIYINMIDLQSVMSGKAAQLIGKLVATALVMIFNFVTRKIFLEKREPAGNEHHQ